jgi:AcrR family transcriptional regulator
MAREQRPGDWAAWMTGSAGSGAPVDAPARRSTSASPPDTDDAPAGGPSGTAAGPVEPPHDDHDGHPDAARSPRREATRQRILDAAREVFAERGVIGGTVEDICERAGFTRGAFYSNFADKDDVIDALMEREQDRVLDHLESIFGDVEREIVAATDLEAVLGTVIDRVLRAIPLDRELTLVQTELENFAIRRPDLGGRFHALDRRFRTRIAGFLGEAMSRAGRDLLVDPLLLTDAIVGVSQRSCRRALLEGDQADPDELAGAILPRLLVAFSRPVGGAPGP